MICNTCGRQTQNEKANFCEYCGSSYREHVNMVHHSEPQREVSIQQVEEKPITFGNWLIAYGILFGSLFIPYIGWIIPVVMLFVWSFGNSTSKTKQNWARATLVFAAIYIILVIIIVISLINTPMMQNMINSLGNSGLLNGL